MLDKVNRKKASGRKDNEQIEKFLEKKPQKLSICNFQNLTKQVERESASL